MLNKIIIIYQSGLKTGNTKYIAEQIAKELNCKVVDIATNPVINLEEYNLIGFGSGVYFWSVGCKLKKWIKNIKWSSKEACKPDAFIFTTQGAKKATRVHGRFNHFLHKKAGITTITGWACQTKQVHSSEALTNLKEWVDSKIHTPSHTKTSSKN